VPTQKRLLKDRRVRDGARRDVVSALLRQPRGFEGVTYVGLVETDLNGLIMEVGEAAEFHRSGREPSGMRLRDDMEHNLSLFSCYTSTTRSRKSCTTGVRIRRCGRC
jgi:hypothetical protein